ncbi:peptidylprolyl isomerase [Pedobacter deserti]|uniref:peptidylprolyl isomerase n=1 Tax=Pedobacter deserti TaxID=2817382 RepID=UPI00210ED447|nr:peptidylprolyl isomerase [Pedobacter sp. SYSU D00382]
MKRLLTLLLCLSLSAVFGARPKHKYVRIQTSMGECVIKLYNETPLHRDNFVKLAKKKTIDGTLFHRVINGFMIQGGDPDSKTAQPGSELGNGDVGYTVPAEFRDSLFHKKGVLAAARDNNPEKASSGCQFYLVQGKIFTDEMLDALESKRQGFKIPGWQREIYKTAGGTPHLDQNYTVFGEIVQGVAMVDSIATVATDERNRPLTDVRMAVKLLSKREARRLERKLSKS